MEKCIETIQTNMFHQIMCRVEDTRRKAYTITCHTLFIKEMREVADMVEDTMKAYTGAKIVHITVTPDIKIKDKHKYYIFDK